MSEEVAPPYAVINLADQHLPRWRVGDDGEPIGGTPFSRIPGLEWIDALPYGVMESDTGNVIGGFASPQIAHEFVNARNAWWPANGT